MDVFIAVNLRFMFYGMWHRVVWYMFPSVSHKPVRRCSLQQTKGTTKMPIQQLVPTKTWKLATRLHGVTCQHNNLHRNCCDNFKPPTWLPEFLRYEVNKE